MSVRLPKGFKIKKTKHFSPEVHQFLKDNSFYEGQDVSKVLLEVTWRVSMVVWHEGSVVGVYLLKLQKSPESRDPYGAKKICLIVDENYDEYPIKEALEMKAHRSKEYNYVW